MTTGASISTKERPSHPAKDAGGPLRYQDVVTLSSHTSKGPPAGSPCDHRRARCRYTLRSRHAARRSTGSGTAGTRVTVSTVAQDPFKLAVGRYFVGLLDALGYRADLRTYPDDHSYYEKAGLEQSRSQIGFFGWEADYPAGSAFFEPLFTCVAYRPHAPYDMNPAGYCDPQVDDQISRATSQQTVNVAAANRAWRQLDTEVTQDAPWIPLVNPLGIDVVSARVGNYQRNPVFGVLLDQLWVR